MANKPLLFAKDFDDSHKYDPEFWEGRGADPSYIPGYSEIVQANDIDKADDLDFQLSMRDAGGKFKTKEDVFRFIGAQPQELPVEFMWLPASGTAGGQMSGDAARQLDSYMNRQGFRPASKEDLESHGYRTTQAMYEAPDGTIRRGPDVALYVRSGEVARKWERHKQKKAAEAEGQKPLPDELVDKSGNYTAETFEEEQRTTERITH